MDIYALVESLAEANGSDDDLEDAVDDMSDAIERLAEAELAQHAGAAKDLVKVLEHLEDAAVDTLALRDDLADLWAEVTRQWLDEVTISGHAPVVDEATAETHYVAGTTALAAGDHVAAMEAFQDAVDKLKPTNAANYYDMDGDGLEDDEEILLGTDPLVVDTDGDGLSDGDEVSIYLSNPLLTDTDGDGLYDDEEVLLYDTDPAESDTDGDGLDDGEELTVYLTDPLLEDTDGDGLSDGEEVLVYGTSPVAVDGDGDGVNDYVEVIVLGTDPANGDTDGDGVDDGTDNCPLVPNADQADADSDGVGDVCDAPLADSAAEIIEQLRVDLSAVIDDPNTPQDAADDLEDKVMAQLDKTFEKLLKGDVKQLQKEMATAIEEADKITGFDTSDLQEAMASASIDIFEQLLNRARDIAGSTDDDVEDGEDAYVDALIQLAAGDFEDVADDLESPADDLKKIGFENDYCPAEATEVYEDYLCQLVVILDLIEALDDANPTDNNLSQGASKIEDSIEKLVEIDMVEATRKASEGVDKLDDATTDTSSEQQLIQELWSDAVRLWLDEATISGHKPDKVSDAEDDYDDAESEAAGGNYADAMDAYQDAVEQIKP